MITMRNVTEGQFLSFMFRNSDSGLAVRIGEFVE